MLDTDDGTADATSIEEVGDFGLEIAVEDEVPEVGKPSPELEPIARLGRYELLGRMAVGGMAEIFLARERARAGGSRQVAVKVMRPHLSDDAELGAMFVNEGRVALRLNHPNICHVYEFGLERGRCFIAMEHVHGVTLRDVARRLAVRGERMPIAVVVGVVARVAEALHAAHQAKDAAGRPLAVVHRDVSPHNVMIGFDGVVKLLDFGVARARTGNAERTDTIKGKFGYLAPEQCVGAPVDARTDVFALGVCLWEALTGRRLYRRTTDYESLQAIVHVDAPDPSTLVPDLPARLSAITLRALSRDPERRFASAAEMQDALEQYLVDERERVGTTRIQRYVHHLFDDRASAPPELDRRPDVVAWIGADQSPPRRAASWAVVAAALIAAISIAWIAWPEQPDPAPAVAAVSVSEPPRAALPPLAFAQARRSAAPETPSSTSNDEPAVVTAADDRVAVAPVTSDVMEEERAARRHRRRPIPGGFVEDPGF